MHETFAHRPRGLKGIARIEAHTLSYIGRPFFHEPIRTREELAKMIIEDDPHFQKAPSEILQKTVELYEFSYSCHRVAHLNDKVIKKDTEAQEVRVENVKAIIQTLKTDDSKKTTIDTMETRLKQLERELRETNRLGRRSQQNVVNTDALLFPIDQDHQS